MGRKPSGVLTAEKLKAELKQIAEKAQKPFFELSTKDASDALADNSPMPIKYYAFDEADDRHGYFDRDSGAIIINQARSDKTQLKALIHELCFLDYRLASHTKSFRRLSQETEPAQIQYIAQAKAYAICSYFGLSTNDYRFEGLNAWQQAMSSQSGKQSPGGQDEWEVSDKTANETSKQKEEAILLSAFNAVEGISLALVAKSKGIEPVENKLGKKSLDSIIGNAKTKRIGLYGKAPEKPNAHER